MKPTEIQLDDNPITQALINTLGRAELEFVAALIVRWHHVHGLTEWTSVSRADIATLFEQIDPIVAAWSRNPFWSPDPGAFIKAGLIEGWDGDGEAKGTLTPKFFAALDAEHARRHALEHRKGA